MFDVCANQHHSRGYAVNAKLMPTRSYGTKASNALSSRHENAQHHLSNYFLMIFGACPDPAGLTGTFVASAGAFLTGVCC